VGQRGRHTRINRRARTVARANGVYVSSGGGEIVSPSGDINSHNMAYHMVTLFQQIGRADVQGIFCPDVKGIGVSMKGT